MPKNIPDPSGASRIRFEYLRRIGSGQSVMRATYVDQGAENPSPDIPATPAVDGLIDALYQAMLGSLPPTMADGGGPLRIVIDNLNGAPQRSITVEVQNPTQDGVFARRGSALTAPIRNAAGNVLAQALADGLRAAMGF